LTEAERTSGYLTLIFMVSEAMSSALKTRKGKPEKLSSPALANRQFQNRNQNIGRALSLIL
jgi:hypothetical protein